MHDPLHEPGSSTIAWSTANLGENFPGVATPLGWTFWRSPLERGMRGGFADFGVLAPREVLVAESADHRFTSVFYGRAASNVDQLRAVSDLMPGTSGSDSELQLLGSVRPNTADQPSRHRYPHIAAKMPTTILRVGKRLADIRSQTDTWWHRSTRPDATATQETARALLVEAGQRYEQIMRIHVAATMWGGLLYAQLTALARTAGHPGLETTLVSGYGGLEEAKSISDLWELSRGRLTLEQFLDRHGYHAPVEAELRSISWREDPQPVQARADSYRRKPDSSAPATITAHQRENRLAAEATLLAALPAHRKPQARLLLHLGARYIPLREVGKAAFLQTIDVGRAAARALGEQLHAQGTLLDPDDIYFLTVDEVITGLSDGLPELVKQRRATFEHYEQLDLPDWWIGTPELTAGDSHDAIPLVCGGAIVASGIAVSRGIVDGVARVMTGPDSGDLDDGEILVCNTTDPSWASLFFVAGALVIDIGGPMSHGAIVAREMGIPCVINTRTGTRTIRTGDHIRVDGATGTVTLTKHGVGPPPADMAGA